MSLPNVDAKSKSLSEAFANSFGSYPIGYAIGLIILPLSTGWLQKDPLTANLIITTIYALISFTRTYYLRRLFEKIGFDDNFIRLTTRLFKRILNFIPRNKNTNSHNKEETCVVCRKNCGRKEKRTCSYECAKTYILRIVKPDLGNHSSLKSFQPVLPQDTHHSLLKLKLSCGKRQMLND